MKLITGKRTRTETYDGDVDVNRGFDRDEIYIPLGDSNRVQLTNDEALELILLLSVAISKNKRGE